jgi:hypothetical protein
MREAQRRRGPIDFMKPPYAGDGFHLLSRR